MIRSENRSLLVQPSLWGDSYKTMSSKNAFPPSNAMAGTSEKWVKVTWMPHTTLSQTSHVCLTIRSAHASLDALLTDRPQDWKVRVGLYGVAGLLMVPVFSHTPAAQVSSRKRARDESSTAQQSRVPRPTVAKATHDCIWDTFVQIPIRWRDLPRDAYLLLEVLGNADTVIYSAPMPFFSRYGKLSTGLQRLKLESYPLATDLNHGLQPLQPQGENTNDWGDDEDPVWKASCILHELEQQEESSKSAPTTQRPSSFGQTTRVPWLDALQKQRALQILEAARANQMEPLIDEYGAPASLIVELPVFDIPVMHEETFYSIPQQGASGSVAPLDLFVYHKQAKAKDASNPSFDPLQLVPFLDYENEHDNPFEDKYRTLAHDLLRGLVDPALKPDREQRDRLAAIIDSPSHHLTLEEKDLLWRFRFSLVDNRRALTKFLLAVDWTVESEVVQAAELLEQWRKRSPIEVTDALKLLGKHVAFQTNLVRTYAIDTLAAAPDSELRLYLLQLVQALKYETMVIPEHESPTRIGSKTSPPGSPVAQVSSLASFLINRAAGNAQLANYLYWYLKVELQDPIYGVRYREVFSALKARLSNTPFVTSDYHDGHPDDSHASTSFKSIVDSVSKLGTPFRGSDNGASERDRSAKKGTKHKSVWDVLFAQDSFISGVMDIQLRCRDARGKKDVKEAQLQSLLSKEGYDRKDQRDAIPLPSAPELLVNGVFPDTAKMFKSALYPALIEFHVEGTLKRDDQTSKASRATKVARNEIPLSSYKVIVKTGDELKQDQLIIMMIQLMDRLLKRAALDLCLTPYAIIATSPTSGLVEFVDGSFPISQILSKYNGSIMSFFQSVAPQKGAKYDVRQDVMSTYVRSCAGYCVITFLLGVGDRHLDNILLRASGHFFHIDFGFIFGRDPKPLPPAFRLTREMVDGFGGLDSSEYRQFCSLACQAFNALRKSAGLVLNLLHLMSDAGIEDLSNNPSADAEGVLAKVEERFRLDLTDEQAERYFLGLINDCLTAIAPRVMDVFHSFSVARR